MAAENPKVEERDNVRLLTLQDVKNIKLSGELRCPQVNPHS
jgi:hypothetical protein